MNLSDNPVVCEVQFDVQEEYKRLIGEDKLEVAGEKGNIELHPWQFRVYKRI